MIPPIGKRRTKIAFLSPPIARDPSFNTPIGAWTVFTQAWAEVQDFLPSRGERVADGINLEARPARIRTLYLEGITSAMRVRVGGEGGRVLEIVSGPAELGHREGHEVIAEEISTTGEAA